MAYTVITLGALCVSVAFLMVWSIAKQLLNRRIRTVPIEQRPVEELPAHLKKAFEGSIRQLNDLGFREQSCQLSQSIFGSETAPDVGSAMHERSKPCDGERSSVQSPGSAITSCDVYEPGPGRRAVFVFQLAKPSLCRRNAGIHLPRHANDGCEGRLPFTSAEQIQHRARPCHPRPSDTLVGRAAIHRSLLEIPSRRSMDTPSVGRRVPFPSRSGISSSHASSNRRDSRETVSAKEAT